MVADYTATLKRLKERAKEKRMGDMYHQQDLEQQWKPVIQSNEKMMGEISKELKPIKRKIESINEFIKDEPDQKDYIPSDGDGQYGPLASAWKRRILAQDPDVDRSFGIRFEEDGNTYMGNKEVIIRGDDLIIDGDLFTGTPGLWTLITGTTKSQIGLLDETYNSNDLFNYGRLLEKTSVLHHDFEDENPYPRANGSWKWKNLLKEIWEVIKNRAPLDTVGSGLHDLVKSGKMYIQKKGKCYHMQKCSGDGLYLTPHHPIPQVGNGLFLRHGGTIYDGKGLVLGPNSPFKNIPILGWLL